MRGSGCISPIEFALAVVPFHRSSGPVNLNEADQDFLRDLVKTSRQRPHQVPWTDRDGSARVTCLTPTDAARLNALAHRLGMGPAALLQQGAHLSAKKADKPG
jgi:hypothetical protein